jgi:phosphatidylinositol-3-phosphatase
LIGDLLRRWEQGFGSLPLPSSLVWAVLALAFLGFGVLLGRATGGDSVGALASARSPLKLVVAQASTGTSAGSSGVAKPPPAAEEATPGAVPAPSSKPTEKAAELKVAPPPGSKAGSGESGSKSASGSKSSGEPEGASGSAPGSAGVGSGGSKATLPAIKHVFVLMLDQEPYATVFGPASPAHYLSVLENKGELLVRYYGVAHEALADGIGLLSGQGPTEATAANCPTYSELAPTGSAHGQILGQGCVYPSSTPTLMGQLIAKHLSWRAYVEGLDEGHSSVGACAHPVPGAADPSAAPVAPGASAPLYQTWRNPFVYFGSVANSAACASRDVGIGRLGHDLGTPATTPAFSYIAPGPCDDGSPEACAPGKASGMSAADVFLEKYVPQILTSPAFKKDGLLAITVDNAPTKGQYADASSCCGQPRFPNLPPPSGAAALAPQGGGQVGLLLLSPFIKKRGGLAQEPYNHYSLLATIEQIFGLPKLGYAGLSEVKSFSASLFSGG